jgi:tetratricopeptide (TPR) repeat protein
VINAIGPFVDPGGCYAQGQAFAQGGLLRQAAHQFARVKTLAPGNLGAWLSLAQVYLLAKMPDEALKLIKEIHAQPDVVGLGLNNRADVLSVEISALLAKQDVGAAEATIQTMVKQYPGSDDLLVPAARVFIGQRLYTNALALIEQQLKTAPDHPAALRHQGFVCLQLGKFDQAIGPLTRVLDMETNKTTQAYYTMMLNRAIAYLHTDRLDEAQRDYEAVQKVSPHVFQVYRDLGEIAWRKHDTAAAMKNYQLYLANSPENPEEIKTVKARLKELQPGSP